MVPQDFETGNLLCKKACNGLKEVSGDFKNSLKVRRDLSISSGIGLSTYDQV